MNDGRVESRRVGAKCCERHLATRRAVARGDGPREGGDEKCEVEMADNHSDLCTRVPFHL